MGGEAPPGDGATSIHAAAERERLRLGRLLHDDIQQRLYSLRIQLIEIRDAMLRDEDASQSLLGALESADVQLLDTIQATRRLTRDLASPDERMRDALESVVAYMLAVHGLTVEIAYGLGTSEPCRTIRATVARVIRELLFNVVKHAGVETARVTAHLEGDVMRFEVRDEGRGFLDAPMQPGAGAPGEGFGLQDARVSLQRIGGDMTVATVPGAGTSVQLMVPVRKRS